MENVAETNTAKTEDFTSGETNKIESLETVLMGFLGSPEKFPKLNMILPKVNTPIATKRKREILEPFYYWFGYQIAGKAASIGDFESKVNKFAMVHSKHSDENSSFELMCKGVLHGAQDYIDLKQTSPIKKFNKKQIEEFIRTYASSYHKFHCLLQDAEPQKGYGTTKDTYIRALYFLLGYTLSHKPGFDLNLQQLFAIDSELKDTKSGKDKPAGAFWMGVTYAVEGGYAAEAANVYFKQKGLKPTKNKFARLDIPYGHSIPFILQEEFGGGARIKAPFGNGPIRLFLKEF